jgi:hypothetical protein
MMDKATAATTAGNAAASSTLFVSGMMFGISALVTLAFGYALITDPTRLADAWVFVRALPLLVQIVLWAIFLPWMVALWALSLPLATGVRIAIVVVILVAAEYLLFPWKKA